MEEELQGKGEQEEKMPTTLDGFLIRKWFPAEICSFK
jgi:hypothetical protein